MRLAKWNYKKREYEPYEVPDDWNVKAYAEDLYEIVNCAHCGQELPMGETYTSMEIHTPMGFGYGVCSDCYYAELERRNK